MSDALEEHDGKVNIGGRNITNLRFASDAVAVKEQELEVLNENLDETCTGVKWRSVPRRPKRCQTATMAPRLIKTGYRYKVQVPWSSCFR